MNIILSVSRDYLYMHYISMHEAVGGPCCKYIIILLNILIKDYSKHRTAIKKQYIASSPGPFPGLPYN